MKTIRIGIRQGGSSMQSGNHVAHWRSECLVRARRAGWPHSPWWRAFLMATRPRMNGNQGSGFVFCHHTETTLKRGSDLINDSFA